MKAVSDKVIQQTPISSSVHPAGEIRSPNRTPQLWVRIQ